MSAPTTLAAAHAEVRAESVRTDTKTGLLLAVGGAVLAGSWTVAKDVPLTAPAYVAGAFGLALLVVAAGLLLRSVRPNLRGGHGFPLWATLTADQITATLTTDQAAAVANRSRIAMAKYTGLRRAIDLTLAGGALLILAALLALGGAV